MRDPVTGFLYPVEWVERCTNPCLLDLVEQGLAILTASGTVLRRGYTTGTTAAAVCKAAILSLKGPCSSASIRIPVGLTIDVPVRAECGRALCRKYAGDYPDDVTAGIEFIAEAKPAQEGIRFIPDGGIGRFSRDTPRYKKGTPAISPAPLECILTSMQEAMDETGLSGVEVTLLIPEGERVARQTLNPRVGVECGISILGTTGLVEPWDDHLGESVQARVAAAKKPVLTTGRVGLRYARLLFPDREVILVGGKIGEALDAAKGDVVLFGLPALILLFIRPEILKGTGYRTVEELAASPGFDRIVPPVLAEWKKAHAHVNIILVNREGTVIAESP